MLLRRVAIHPSHNLHDKAASPPRAQSIFRGNGRTRQLTQTLDQTSLEILKYIPLEHRKPVSVRHSLQLSQRGEKSIMGVNNCTTKYKRG